MHAVRRRKKRPSNGVRTVEVYRGNNGFGFTISGQQPCILSCIVRDSPAERAGLRSGDYLVAVNGQNVGKALHDDVVRLIGSCSGLLKLQIAENYYSDSSDEDRMAQARSKPKHQHKTRSGKGRVAKVVRDLRSGVMFDGVELGQEAWDVPALPPPRVQCPKEELCFFLGYLGTIEMPQMLPPGSRAQVVRCCVKRLRAEKRTYTNVVMRVHSEGVTLTGAEGLVIAHYPVHRLCYAGPGADQDRKYVGLVTSAPSDDGDVAASSSCHVFAVQASLADHDKHLSKVAPFHVNCTSGPLSEGCFEFPSTSEPVLNAVRSFCLTKEEEQAYDNEMVLANSPQPSHAGSTAASSNSDSGIGFRDDGNQSDRIVMVDVENQRLHIQQLCDDGHALDIQLNKDGRAVDIQLGGREVHLNGPSANLQQAFACVNALCPRPALRAVRSRSPLNSSDEPERDRSYGHPWAEQSVLLRLGILPDYSDEARCKSSENLDSAPPSDLSKRCSKSYDNIYSDEMKFSPQVHASRSPFSVSYGEADVPGTSTRSLGSVIEPACEESGSRRSPWSGSTSRSVSCGPGSSSAEAGAVCNESARTQWSSATWRSLSLDPGSTWTEPGVASSSRSIYFTSTDDSKFGGCERVSSPRPRVAHSLEELAAPPPPPPFVWGSLQDLPSLTQVNEEKEGKDGEKEEGAQAWASSFERLLDDPQGLETFTTFLRKEFSQENMIFWLACSKYERTESGGERRNLARQIFAAHLADGAPEPVNVDAHAMLQAKAFLDSGDAAKDAPADLFLPAQKQVFNLMKFDSYPRFLKSQLYQELCQRPVVTTKSRNQHEDGRRKSLLPWSRKLRSKSKDRSASASASVNGEVADDAVSLSSKSSVTSWDCRISRHSSMSSAEPGLVRIVLNDGSTAVLQIQDGETIRELMERVLAKRGISYNAYEVYTPGESKPRGLDGPASELAKHEVRLEQRVLFRLDLPNRKTISVKAKTNKTLEQVLRPVLHKYNYLIDLVTICSMSENEVIELSVPITTVDGRRLTVLTRSADAFAPPLPPMAPPTKTFIRSHASLDEITNKVFEELLANKSSGSSAAGSVRSEASSSTLPMPMPRFLRMRRKGVPVPAHPVKTERSDTDDLYEGLKRAQRSRLEDQRGTEINYELPDFLKNKENNPQSGSKVRKLREEVPVPERTAPPTPAPSEEAKIRPPHEMARNHNFLKPNDIKTYARLNRGRRVPYLEEPSSSFV